MLGAPYETIFCRDFVEEILVDFRAGHPIESSGLCDSDFCRSFRAYQNRGFLAPGFTPRAVF